MTEPVNNLTAKLTALTTTLGGKLDTIAADIAALRLDVAALQGDAPSNTLQSINQSLWNIAGPAPGTTLTDLLAALESLRGVGGATGLYSLKDLAGRLEIIASTTGSVGSNAFDILCAIGDITTNPANYTVRDLLALLQTSLDTQPPDAAGPNVPPGSETCGPWTRAIAAYPVGTATYQFSNYIAWSIGFANNITMTPVTQNAYYSIDHYIDSGNNTLRRLQRAYSTNSGIQGASVCFGWNITDHASTAPTKIVIYAHTLIETPTSSWFLPLVESGSVATIYDGTIYPTEGPIPTIYGHTENVFAGMYWPQWHNFDVAAEMILLMPESVTPDFTDYFIIAKGPV